jgi:hypothetical protein
MDRLALAWLSILLRFILPRPFRLGFLTDDAINMAKPELLRRPQLSFRCRISSAHWDAMSISIRDLIAALALGTIVYRWAIADNTESRGDDVHVGLLERLYRLRQLMAGTWWNALECASRFTPPAALFDRHPSRSASDRRQRMAMGRLTRDEARGIASEHRRAAGVAETAAVLFVSCTIRWVAETPRLAEWRWW